MHFQLTKIPLCFDVSGGLFGETFIIRQLLPLLKQVARSCVNVSNTTKPEPVQSWSALALVDCLTTLDGLAALLPGEVVVKELVEVWMSFAAIIKLVLFTMKT